MSKNEKLAKILQDMEEHLPTRREDSAKKLKGDEDGFAMSILASAVCSISLMESVLVDFMAAKHGEDFLDLIYNKSDEERLVFYQELNNIVMACLEGARNDMQSAANKMAELYLKAAPLSNVNKTIVDGILGKMKIDKKEIH